MIDFKIKIPLEYSWLQKFYCGIPTMDNFIHSGLELCVSNHYCSLFQVINKDNDETIALFSLAFDSLTLDNDDKEEVLSGASMTPQPLISPEYEETFLNKTSYPAIEITYLAVSQSYRKVGIGTRIIEAILSAIRKQKLAGCQFVTVEALFDTNYSAISFYYKCLFTPCELPNPNKGTLRMFKTLYPQI